MNDHNLYRWLDQQGEAFGAPGLEPRWTSSVKDAIGTAYAASSRVWFTCSHGILNEVYHPTIDRAQIRDMEFLVTDGETFAHEEKRDLITSFEYIHPEALGVRYVNRDPEGRYSLTHEIIADPHHSVVLQWVKIDAHEDLLPRLKVYALLAPHLDGGGAGNTARAVDIAGRKMLLAWKNEWSLAMGASCGFSRVSCGFVGTSDGWRDVMENYRMDWEFGSADNGNIAVLGELNLGAAGDDGSRVVCCRHRNWRRASHRAAKDGECTRQAVRRSSRAVHRAVAASGQSGVARSEGGRRRQADARQPQRSAGP